MCRELHESDVTWKPVFVVALKSIGGVDAPSSCFSFPGAVHSNRPMLIGLEDGQLVSESYCRPDSAQVRTLFLSTTLYILLGLDTALPGRVFSHLQERCKSTLPLRSRKVKSVETINLCEHQNDDKYFSH